MTETTSPTTVTSETVADFAERARSWLADNMPRVDADQPAELRPRRGRPLGAGT